jgi:hypothetical protein
MLYAASLAQGFRHLSGAGPGAAFTLLVPKARHRAIGIREMAFPLAGVALRRWQALCPLAGCGDHPGGLLTFTVAIAAIWRASIPRPPVSAEGLAAAGSWLTELMGGLRYIIKQPGLSAFLLYETTTYFLLNGPLVPFRTCPRTGNGRWRLHSGVESLGALAGASLPRGGHGRR